MNKEKEIETVTLMVRPVLPGRTWDKGRGTLPGVCRLLEYARQRRDGCPHGEIDSRE